MPLPSSLGRSTSPGSPYSLSETQHLGPKVQERSGYCQRPGRVSGVTRRRPTWERQVDMEPAYRGLGRCACCFWLAVAFDIVGLLVLLIGVFVNVFFYDLLIYAGAIVIFLSLIWWVFWYSGNIEVPPAELEDDVGLLKKDKGISGAVRRFSSRLTGSIRNSFRRSGAAHRSGTGPPAAPQGGQVTVAMATINPQEDSVSTAAEGEIQMPHTATESLPA